jgi:glutamate-1-semialdehyde 2,1-aminomutase
MKLALATALLVGSATAFAPTFGARGSSTLKSAVADTYTFTKSEEIFKEAQDVSESTVAFQ